MIMELHSSFALLTSLTLPASSQDNLMSNTHELHSSVPLNKLVGRCVLHSLMDILVVPL